MRIYMKFLVVICLIGLNSCNVHDEVYSNKNLNFYSKNDFKNLKQIKSKKLPFKYDSIIFPEGMDIVNNHLILLDDKTTYPLQVYNLETYQFIGSYGKKGRGPGEIKHAKQLFSDNDDLFFMYDLELKKILGYSLESLLEDKPMFDRKINESGYCISITMIENNIYYTDFYGNNNSFYKLDTISGSIETFGSLIHNAKGVANKTFSQACAAHIIHGNNNIITAYKYAPFFEIYNLDTNKITSILTIDKFPPIYDELSNNGHKIFSLINGETRNAFIALDTSENYIYMLFSGNVISTENFYKKGNRILVFDYDGKPISLYNLDTPIYNFKVVNDESIIGLSSDITVDVVKFNL
ncbi:hypothetical protein ATO12_17225 [Aquimarina atlantica]|uniref:Lipoprotein n=1 Tax=Aquimarina atlantica TaxID=1317122 RepID=A0A023BV67_9FLAO|nr:BF3164 family lipoprotein [Aquimarina atlantica]EZH73678.1 hypothetical protein ATO12_17225 [Aquimarina atlantica]